ncbi:hypothetical protein GCK32_010672 [Trichostrongylus colubriformis]|uniref:Uncharacterized protein n=1 Tax=Trichostrongylus colubriformis TaxID=6319 RepID=A0AAN8IAL6_TRICO
MKNNMKEERRKPVTSSQPHQMIVENFPKWKIFLVQATVPVIIAIPLYCIFNFQYGLKGLNVPLLLSTRDPNYDPCIFFIGLTYRLTALISCLCGYVYLFNTIRRKRARAEFKILLHGVCLVTALVAVIISSLYRRYQIGETSQFMRVFFLTTMLWIPCTNILVTIYTTKSLRTRMLHPLRNDNTSMMVVNAFHLTSTKKITGGELTSHRSRCMTF